jgi:hypothetical protein
MTEILTKKELIEKIEALQQRLKSYRTQAESALKESEKRSAST